jgi:tRNA threonylcarbamoyl adenosine modification protein YeaZ
MSVRLAIEISNPSSWEPGDPMPGLALGQLASSGGACELLGVEAIDPTRPHDDDLMPGLDRLCSRLSMQPKQITSIAISVGPGGFTATRVAVTTAKCLAAALGGDCIAVPSALVAAQHALRADEKVESVLVLLAAKGSSVYAQRVVRGLLSDAGAAMDVADVSLDGVQLILADRFARAALEPRVKACEVMGIEIQRPVFTPHALLQASMGFESVELARLLPIYPREPEAVTKWRALKAAGKK